MVEKVWQSTTRVRFEPRRRVLKVQSLEVLGKSFMRMKLGGCALEDFKTLSFDDHVKVEIEISNGECITRNFTARQFDAARLELTIDIALHEGSPASNWARQAHIGQSVAIAGPRGSTIVSADYDWYLLAGDASAIPAIARRMEEMPHHVHTFAFIELAEESTRRHLQLVENVNACWADSAQSWLTALRRLALPRGEGFIWCAGEANAIKKARNIFIDQHSHPPGALRTVAYWKVGEVDFNERLAA